MTYSDTCDVTIGKKSPIHQFCKNIWERKIENKQRILKQFFFQKSDSNFLEKRILSILKPEDQESGTAEIFVHEKPEGIEFLEKGC